MERVNSDPQEQVREEPEGQLSEVVRLDPAEADVPIQPDQAVAGSPDGESGRPQEGRAGPNARTGSDTDAT